jgi:hypothetical protein
MKLDIHAVCALRPEVRDAVISRDNEISKIVDSNFVSLSWPSQARMNNPLIELLRRKLHFSHESIEHPNELIPNEVWAVAEKRRVEFPVYFLNITWYRPRDVIRVLKSYQVSNGDKFQLFSANDDQFAFLKEYSRVSRQDIIAELEVKYSKRIIEEVLRRFKYPTFTNRDHLLEFLDILSNRVDLDELLKDLYDAGVILNHEKVDGRVQVYASYRNDSELDPDLRIIVHRGLQTSMHMGFELDWGSDEET